jgi:phage baseplate assembly protein gpV
MAGEFNGVLIGVVQSVDDPQGEGRVEVSYTAFRDGLESFSAPIASPMAGKDRGFRFCPEVGDECLVAFDRGDPDHPYILGFLHNGVDRPPAADPHERVIQSVNGHRIVFRDDQPAQGDRGSLRIEDAHGTVVEMTNGHTRLMAVGQLDIDAPVLTLGGRAFQPGQAGGGALGELPDPPDPLSMTLPGGVTLTGQVELPDFASGDCRVAFNLLLQLAPALGSMECLIRVMKFVGWLLDFVKAVPGVVTNPTKLLELLGKLPPIADDLAGCVASFTPVGIPPAIKSMLQVVHSYLSCLVDLLDSIVKRQALIQAQLDQAGDNPELQRVLGLAQDNAAKMGQQAVLAGGPVLSILDTIGTLLEIAQLPAISAPSLDDLTGGGLSDALEPLQTLLDVLGQVIDVIPG